MENIYLPKPYSIVSIDKVAEIEWLFTVEFDKEVNAGQFIEVSLPMVGEAPISIANINKEASTIDFLIRKVGKVTDKLFDLKVGDQMYLRGPYGNSFDLDSFENKEILVISGGSGIAPVKPIIKRFYSNKKFKLLCGFKDESKILFHEELIEYSKDNSNIMITLDSSDNKQYKNGFVIDHLDCLLDNVDLNNVVVIVVGPPLMMKFTTLKLIEKKIRKEDIIVSFERNMSCAVGKCGHCKIDETYICLEGPVFEYLKAETLLD